MMRWLKSSFFPVLLITIVIVLRETDITHTITGRGDNTNMGKISIEELKPGLTLQSDVKDRSGRMLLSAGAVIEPKHIKILRTWGISEVEVTDTSETDAAETNNDPLKQFDSSLLEAATQQAERIFYHCDCSHPAISALFNQTVLRYAMRMA